MLERMALHYMFLNLASNVFANKGQCPVLAYAASLIQHVALDGFLPSCGWKRLLKGDGNSCFVTLRIMNQDMLKCPLFLSFQG